MKVLELREILKDMPDDDEVQVEYDFDCDGQNETYHAGIESVEQYPDIVFINTGKRI